MPVPSFSGKFTDWPGFFDSFTQLIHSNVQLNAVQRFHYLKQGLPADRDADIQQMLLTESSYAVAWEMLKKRYNNPRILFAHYMNSLYQLPTLTKERADDIKTMLNAANVCIIEFKRLNIAISQCDHWIAHYLATKLPTETHYAWERHLGNQTQVPTFSELEAFLHTRLFTIDAIENRNVTQQGTLATNSRRDHQKPTSPFSQTRSSPRYKPEGKSFHLSTKVKPVEPESCPLCPDTHLIRRCPVFLSKDCFERKDIIDKVKHCLNCLSKSHAFSKCTSTKNCFQCGQRHHTLLHFSTTPRACSTAKLPRAAPTVTTPSHRVNTNNSGTHNAQWTPTPPMDGPSTSAAAAAASNRFTNAHTTALTSAQLLSEMPRDHGLTTTLLATALVTLTNDDTQQSAPIHALIDQGSEVTLISEHVAQSLRLKRHPTSTEICGIGSNILNKSSAVITCTLRSHTESTFATALSAYVVNRLNTTLPSQRFQPQSWPHIQGLPLADPTFYQPKRIDLIIGADLYAQIIRPETLMGEPGEPIAQRTHLGWILSGMVECPAVPRLTVRCHHHRIELEGLVKRFFDLEHVPETKSLSAQDEWCEDFFRRTHRRQSTGRYIVRLPLKSWFDPEKTLGKSRQIALNRFLQLERRLQNNSSLRTQYLEGINDYFKLGQLVPTVSGEDQHKSTTPLQRPTMTACVLPHHAVVKEDSATTKVRIVFDASSKTSNGNSLNDLLCTGPPLQNDLPGVTMKWRFHKYVFLTDIQKMYRCINMHPEDSQYQRILWRDQEGTIQEYCLTTVTFGTASAPYTAIRVLHQIAADEGVRFPLATNILKNDIYVDDVLTGRHSIDLTLNMRDQLIAALKSAGMELRKWSSNSPAVLQSIPLEHRSCSPILQLHSPETVKTLGLYWQPSFDRFTFQLNFTPTEVATKRSVLSAIARLFDPLGLLTPVIITAKILLKNIWGVRVTREGNQQVSLDWDDPLPTPLDTTWKCFIFDLQNINKIFIPRWIQYTPEDTQSLQLHVFCDGSSHAYAAAAYLRVKHLNSRVSIHLIAAKSKVTPSSPLTIPRIELCGALLASTLASWIHTQLQALEYPVSTFYCTDATTVLYWIHGDINRWKPFIANRVHKITSMSTAAQGNHVSTNENPADCATRGLSPQQLARFRLWWTGPDWLQQSQSTWPLFSPNAVCPDESTLEERSPSRYVHFTQQNESIIDRYSSLQTLLRVNAFMLRFCHNVRLGAQNPRRSGPLTTTELQESLFQLVRVVQQDAFATEIRAIKAKESLPNKSPLISLTPFLDDSNLLRVRGRLHRSTLPFAKKHPLILPSHHTFTHLIIQNAHANTLHGGTQLTLVQIRHQFWIINARRTVSSVLRNCVICFKNKPVVATQLMGDLPIQRVTPPQRPFYATGIDYTGAIELKSSRYRGNTVYKGYIAIFICLATKAVHLEAVTGMSTEQFLWALQRFIGRRGICHDIFSDCGTNFLGAENVLRNNQQRFIADIERDIIPKLSAQKIQWHFNPPYSPNFGGLWEANVKSIKHHLKRTIGSCRMTYEQLPTVLVRIEACLNSRPLCPLTSDPDDLFVLTPGHFLIGDSLMAPPDSASTGKLLSHHYLEMQRLVRQFWTKWSTDWLSHLQARPKWRHEQPNLKHNELVIIKDDRLPPNQWLLGRIIELHPGPDNLVRVVTVRTQHGSTKRAISKICRLPIPTIDDETTSPTPS